MIGDRSSVPEVRRLEIVKGERDDARPLACGDGSSDERARIKTPRRRDGEIEGQGSQEAN